MEVTVIGAGLAGSEAAWQLAQRGIRVTLREMKPEKKTPAESVYTVSELAGNARSVFGTMQECVVAALKTDGKAEYTVSEAKEIVSKFLQKEVK